MILIHYGELALKKGNRKFFEDKLISNIQKAIPGSVVKRLYGRLLLDISAVNNIETQCLASRKEHADVKKTHNHASLQKQKERIVPRLKKVFGISWFAEIKQVKSSIEEIKKECWEQMQDKKFTTFAIRARRVNKSFNLTSREIELAVADYVYDKIKNPKVDLKNADLNCYVEVVDKQTFIFTNRIKGAGGLPVGVSGRGLVLISGGIDSPVASYYMMKRGMGLDFIHFHSYPQTNKESQEKVKELVKIVGEYQISTKRNKPCCHSCGGRNSGSAVVQDCNNRELYQEKKASSYYGALFLISFLNIQKEIAAKCPIKLRLILYRRMMIRIANEIAKQNNIQALVTGESLAQVASQTIENISVINSVSKAPILRPLIGFDKEETISIARRIGTLEVSNQPDQDCCSMFVPVHPETKAALQEVKQAEKDLDIKKMVLTAIDGMEAC